MIKEDFITLDKLCSLYKVKMSFFSDLNEIGLIDIFTIERTQCIHQDKIIDIEKMIRIHHDLNVNIEGIDIVFNLLQKIEDLQNELMIVKNRLH
ncbi:chaperone modulator CbpM [Lutibacter sp.]